MRRPAMLRAALTLLALAAPCRGDDLAVLAGGELIARLDRNNDGRLNADEWPPRLTPHFARVDANHDGFVDAAELAAGLGGGPEKRPGSGKVIARQLFTVADDFIVDVYLNGERVPDGKRELLVERFGATAERINVEVREGDWLVFNVVNNRLRWGGTSYFAVTGRGDGGVAFTTELSSGRWSCCDDPAQVARFLGDPDSLADRKARPIAAPWGEGDGLMTHIADGWKGSPLWGTSRNTWIKFVAR